MLLLFANLAFGQGTSLPIFVDFPQIAVGGDAGGPNYVTLLQIVNNNSAATTGHLALYLDDGSQLAALFDGQGPQTSMDIPLASGESRQIQLTMNGFARLEKTSSAVTAWGPSAIFGSTPN